MDPLVLTFSFSAGMVSAFNPCGAVLLPTYLAHLFAQGGRVREHKGFRRLVEGASAGMIMTLGFVCVCFSAGLLITLAAQTIRTVLPWVTILMGLALAAVGVAIAAGKRPAWLSAATTVEIPGRGSGRPFTAFFLYGVAFATASLGCTLPVFLIVVAQSFGGGYLSGLAGFLAYALGMGLVVVALSSLVMVGRHLAERWVEAVVPRMERISGFLIFGAGLYLAYYWLWGPGALVR